MKLCTYCKGTHLESNCPLYAKAMALIKNVPVLKSPTFSSNPPAPFVGQYGYPNVNVGILAPGQILPDAETYDDPRGWAARQTPIHDLVGMRASLINSHQVTPVKTGSSAAITAKIVSIAQEVAMSDRPAEVEITLSKLPTSPQLAPDSYTAPTGPSISALQARLTANTHIPHKVDSVVCDTDLKAREGINLLHSKGFDENKIMRLLSIGLLGQAEERKLVPTRWAITATDDMLGKEHLREVKVFPAINDYLFYWGGYLGNYYAIAFLPATWSYELFEMSLRDWRPGQLLPPVSTDAEPFEGRVSYATNTAGGYYTVRLGIVEALQQLKRQASCVAFRFITSEYTLPMGVWVTREATRNALRNPPIRCASKLELQQTIIQTVRQAVGCNPLPLLEKSILFKKTTAQQQLQAFGF